MNQIIYIAASKIWTTTSFSLQAPQIFQNQFSMLARHYWGANTSNLASSFTKLLSRYQGNCSISCTTKHISILQTLSSLKLANCVWKLQQSNQCNAICPLQHKLRGVRCVQHSTRYTTGNTPRVQCAFKIFLIHELLQFALDITFCCVLHQYGNQDIHYWKLYGLLIYYVPPLSVHSFWQVLLHWFYGTDDGHPKDNHHHKL